MHFKLLKKKIGFMNSVRPAPPVCEFYSQNSVFFLIDGFPYLWTLVYMVPKVCGPSCLYYLWYVADARVNRHIAALLHV